MIREFERNFDYSATFTLFGPVNDDLTDSKSSP